MSDRPILLSTLFLTVLMLIGQAFFIRASIKDRTEQLQLLATEPEETVLQRLQTYFEERAYKIIAVDQTNNEVTFQGYVPPSGFIAIFLTGLASIGLLCIAVLLNTLYPHAPLSTFLLLGLAPLAGIFYWRKAGKIEQVRLQMTTATPTPIITIMGHRDELSHLRQVIPYPVQEPD